MIKQERLKEVLYYDRLTGVFTWRIAISNRVKVGEVAGFPSKGYIRIAIDGVEYAAHRLAWFYEYGEWPPNDLDHEDTIKSHNWIDNLRPATRTQNNANSGRPKHNTSGFKGVTWDKKRQCWIAQIMKNKRNHYLGRFAAPEEAHGAYVRASALHFGDFARAS